MSVSSNSAVAAQSIRCERSWQKFRRLAAVSLRTAIDELVAIVDRLESADREALAELIGGSPATPLERF